MDKNSSELLLVQPVDANEDDVSIRTALVRKYVLNISYLEVVLILDTPPYPYRRDYKTHIFT